MNKMSPGSGLSDEKKNATGFMAHNLKVICVQLHNVLEMLAEEVDEYIRGCKEDGGGGGRMNLPVPTCSPAVGRTVGAVVNWFCSF